MARLVEQTRKKKAGSVSEVTGHPKDAATLCDEVVPGFSSVSKDNPYSENNPCNDGRTGRLQRFGRRTFNCWSSDRPLTGNWQKITPTESVEDPVQAEELNKDRVRQLLNRYGMLFRELLQREHQQLQWRSVFRTLRLMEFSGELLASLLFNSVPGLQFISHEAFALLNHSLGRGRIFWLNTCDPASLRGISIEGLK